MSTACTLVPSSRNGLVPSTCSTSTLPCSMRPHDRQVQLVGENDVYVKIGDIVVTPVGAQRMVHGGVFGKKRAQRLGIGIVDCLGRNVRRWS